MEEFAWMDRIWILVVGGDVAMGVWLFGWRAPPSPGIPRSLRFACSRPFRSAKGAWVVV